MGVSDSRAVLAEAVSAALAAAMTNRRHDHTWGVRRRGRDVARLGAFRQRAP